MKIGGWVGKQWEQNKGTIAKVGGAGVGFALGGPAGAMKGYGVGSALANSMKKPASGGGVATNEMADLARRRTGALDTLGDEMRNPRMAQLRNDPAAGINYNRPTVGPRNTSLMDRATAMTRPGSKINNDAIDELRGRGQFSYKDRPTGQMNGDPLEEIKNFRGGAGDLALEMARGGYGGGGGGSGSSSFTPMGGAAVNAMTERANVDELMSFDPSAAFERYATGAQGKMKEALAQSNEKLTGSAAGGGRLNTGFFDLDAGELGRQINTDFRNDFMSKALDTNQQKLSAITSGSTLRANDLSSLRDQYLEAQKATANNQMTAQEANMRYGGQAADRDADFRLKALDMAGQGDDRRFKALTTGRDYMMDDRKRGDDLYDTDRGQAEDSFENYNNRLEGIGEVQREDRGFDNDNFNDDRDWLMDADRQQNDYYEDDRNFETDAWGAENDMRIRGGGLARGDREFEQGAIDSSRDRYLDFLSGSSDRAQGAENARNTTAANRANSRNEMWGSVIGAGAGLAGSYFQNKKSMTSPAVGTTASNNFVKNAEPDAELLRRLRSGGMS